MKKNGSKKHRKLPFLFLIGLFVLLMMPMSVSAAKLNKKSASIYVGKTVKLKVLENTTGKKVKWSSSKSAVATVSSSGVVKGKKAGKTVITAKAGSKKYTCKVTVKNQKATLTADKTTLTLRDSGTVKFTYNANGTLRWKIANSSIVSCKWGKWKKNTIPLYITALKDGTTSITVSVDGTNKKLKLKVTVDHSPTVIKLSSYSETMEPKDSVRLEATPYPTNSTNKSVTWSSSNPEVATVSSYGRVKAVKAGEATITASCASGKVTAACKITVVNPIQIIYPTMPQYIRAYNYNNRLQTSCLITDVRFEASKSGSRYYYKIYVSGTKTYGSSTTSETCKIAYKLYKDKSVVDSGTIYSPAVALNESFTDASSSGFLDTAGEYELVLLNVKS